MMASLAHIMFFTVTVTLLSSTETTGEATELSAKDNQEKLNEYDTVQQSKVLGGNETTAPFLVKLNVPSELQSGILISKRHVIALATSVFRDANHNFKEEDSKEISSLNVGEPLCTMEIQKDWMKDIRVYTCGTDPNCKTSNQFQTPSRGLYIGPFDYIQSSNGIVALEFDTDFHDETAVPISFFEDPSLSFHEKHLTFYGLAKESNDDTLGRVRKVDTKGKSCEGMKGPLYVCTPEIGCEGDRGAPFVALNDQDKKLYAVAINSNVKCDAVTLRPSILLNKVAKTICEFSGVCTKNDGSKSTTTLSKTGRYSSPTTTATKPSSTTTSVPTTTTRPTTAIVTTTRLSSTSKVTTTMTTPSNAPVTGQETLTTPVVVIDIEDEPGLEDEEEEETEYLYIDEPDVSSRDTSVLLVSFFLSFIFLFH